MKKIGILGGSFDPIHNGHLQLASKAYKQFNLDTVIFLPNYQTPFKTQNTITASQHRISMLTLALEEFQEFQVSTYEIEKNTVSFTIDTIYYFKEKYPKDQLFFIIGSDLIEKLHQWKDFNTLIQSVDFIVAHRKDFLFNSESISHIPKPLLILEGVFNNISSTEVRNSLKKEYLVPKKVADYIEKHQLYEEL